MPIARMLLPIALVAVFAVALPASGHADGMLLPPPTPKPPPVQPRPKVCPEVYDPVCATKLGRPRGYPNRCFARMAGAGNIRPGPCSPGY